MKTLRTFLLTLLFVAPALAQERFGTPDGVAINAMKNGVRAGTNDDTANLQSLINRGGYIVLPATNYTSGPLFFTNACTLDGQGGARIDLKPGLTSSTLLNFSSNFNSFIFKGITFSGTNASDCYSTVRTTNATMRTGARPWVNSNTRFDGNCVFRGFDTGIYPLPFTDGLTVQMLPRLEINPGCEFSSNGVAIAIQSASASVCAEYLKLIGLNFHDNSCGPWISAGNIVVEGCLMDHNNVPFILDGSNGFNPGHGSITGNSINHPLSWFGECTNLTVGENIINNLFEASGELRLHNCNKVVVANNHWDVGCRVAFSGTATSPNLVIDNNSHGAFGINTSGLRVFDFALSLDAPTTNLISWSNPSDDQLGFDDAYKWNPYSTNLMLVFPSNLPPASAFTIGGSFEWNSNGVHTFILRSSTAGKAWTSTNLVN